MRRLATMLGAALLAICLSGCAGEPVTEPDPSSRPPFLTTAPLTASPSGTAVPASALAAARWDAITADLRTRGVTGSPEIASVERVVWNNGALGCPKPGASYTQAIVDGMRVVVTAGGATYDYRFGTGDTPVLCAP